jgi:5-methyltetrahydropteroyltriglutamate--homocysteine methyltransferase
LRKIVDLILKVRAGAYLIEAANPRHEHEWKVWKDVKLPAGKILVPGVVSPGTNVVEHPGSSRSAMRFAEGVGRKMSLQERTAVLRRKNLIGAFTRRVMWAKLEAIAEGHIATKQLWN